MYMGLFKYNPNLFNNVYFFNEFCLKHNFQPKFFFLKKVKYKNKLFIFIFHYKCFIQSIIYHFDFSPTYSLIFTYFANLDSRVVFSSVPD